eukprot:TRINITY_DN6761_c0_g1_i1.p1 TRINITY_DN6761_c0_g1~~TRINITY_DN6761_c0_g1_i1.p1  ORF type:complete len:192 (+),score=18.21 TRINITY_DN6761_c0_g1_i1:210-785(+)
MDTPLLNISTQYQDLILDTTNSEIQEVIIDGDSTNKSTGFAQVTGLRFLASGALNQTKQKGEVVLEEPEQVNIQSQIEIVQTQLNEIKQGGLRDRLEQQSSDTLESDIGRRLTQSEEIQKPDAYFLDLFEIVDLLLNDLQNVLNDTEIDLDEAPECRGYKETPLSFGHQNEQIFNHIHTPISFLRSICWRK